MSTNGEDNARAYQGPGIGRRLEQARIEKGLSLKDVERETKIRARYLEGLEQEDFTVLPDAVYVQGFLKTYANYLGLDGEQMARELRAHRSPRRDRKTEQYARPPEEESGFNRPLISPGGLAGTERRRFSGPTLFTIALAVVILLSVVGTLYWIGRGAQPEEGDGGVAVQEEGAPAQQQAPGEVQPPPAGEEQQNGATGGEDPGAESETFRVEVSVQEREAWLEVAADGEVVLAQVAPPGFTRSFDAREEVSITSGDAGAVTVSVNGQDLGPMGRSGEVVTRTYEHKAGG